MKALALEPKVISLANTLRIEAKDPVAGVRKYCSDRVRALIRTGRRIKNIHDLQKIICTRLNLDVYEIWSDAELADLASHYATAGEPVFAYLPNDLNVDTYGVLIRLNKRNGSRYRWAAVVDCRGDKRYRRFFTLWHEIVHCITAADQYELPFHRTKISGTLADPLERLTDIVAGDLAFFDSLFRPALEQQLAAEGRITFESVENVREEFCPEASFESTLNACVTRTIVPTIFVKVGLTYKNAEIDAMNSPQGQLFTEPPPIARLRVITTVTNKAARVLSLRIHRHMRVPDRSIITSIFKNESLRGNAIENLHDWSSSDGDALANIDVNVEARKVGDQIFALVAPT